MTEPSEKTKPPESRDSAREPGGGDDGPVGPSPARADHESPRERVKRLELLANLEEDGVPEQLELSCNDRVSEVRDAARRLLARRIRLMAQRQLLLSLGDSLNGLWTRGLVCLPGAEEALADLQALDLRIEMGAEGPAGHLRRLQLVADIARIVLAQPRETFASSTEAASAIELYLEGEKRLPPEEPEALRERTERPDSSTSPRAEAPAATRRPRRTSGRVPSAAFQHSREVPRSRSLLLATLAAAALTAGWLAFCALCNSGIWADTTSQEALARKPAAALLDRIEGAANVDPYAGLEVRWRGRLLENGLEGTRLLLEVEGRRFAARYPAKNTAGVKPGVLLEIAGVVKGRYNGVVTVEGRGVPGPVPER